MKRFLLTLAVLGLAAGALAQTTATAPITVLIPAGPQGLPGQPGPPGVPATVALGKTTTLAPGAAATVSNSGTAQNAVLDFGIPQGAAGPPGDSSGTGTVAACPTSSAVNFPTRAFQTLTPLAGDSIAGPSTAFASSVPVPANTFTVPGQMIQVHAEITLQKGMKGTPQIAFELNGAAVTTPNGDYIGSALTAPWTYREDYWIVATAIGSNGSVVIFGQQIDETANPSPNQGNARIALTPMTAAIPFDTTAPQTVGFGTGRYSFTGTVQQAFLGTSLWP